MDYYRDPESIEAAAAARRCLAQLAEQLAQAPPAEAPVEQAPRAAETDVPWRPGSSQPAAASSPCPFNPSRIGVTRSVQLRMKLREDMELRAAEEAARASKMHGFRAHCLPLSTSEPR